MNIGVNIIRYTDSNPIPCVIIDFEPKPFGKMEQWLILKNLDKDEFGKTKDKSLLFPIPNSDINNFIGVATKHCQLFGVNIQRGSTPNIALMQIFPDLCR